jgi:hypothetical protein
MADYTAGEVAWLLSLTRTDAIEHDAPSSHLGQPDGAGEGGHRIPTLARWAEVHGVKRRVVCRRRDALAAELVARGYTQPEVAELLDSSQPTIHRRFKASVRDILAELGGEADDVADAPARPSMCLRCGVRPRARVAPIYLKVRGQAPRQVSPERELGVCALCAVDDVGAAA